MSKFSLSGLTRPAYALFAKDYEVNERFCQAVESRIPKVLTDH